MKMLPTGLLLAAAMLPALGQAQTVNICDRTPQVRDVIVQIMHELSPRYVGGCADVPSRRLAGIGGLSFVGSSLTALKAGDFAGMTGLDWLDLSGSQRDKRYDLVLTTLPEDLFDGLTGLEYLHLRNNRLTSLPAGVFSGLTSLQELTLDNNQLTTLPAGLFVGLNGLQTLTLSNNRLTALPEYLFVGLTGLRALTLHDNRLTALPEGLFNGLTGLQTLNLGNNRLTALPEDLFDGLGPLESLELGGNRLTALPEGLFVGLGWLEYLGLGGNHLVRLTENDWRPALNLVSGSVHIQWESQTEAPEQPEPADDGGGSDGDDGDNDGGETAPTHTHPYAPIGHTHVEAYDTRYSQKIHDHNAAYAALSHTHPKRTAARLRLACGERCEAMASQPDIADLIEDTFWLEQAQCSTPRTRDIGAASCQNSSVGRRGLTYCGGGEGNLNSLMTNPPSGIGGKEITISEGVKASVAQTLALQIAELGLTCEEAAVVLYRGQFHLDSCRAQADYGRMAQAIAKATGWEGEGVTLPTFTTITRSRKCGDALSATQ